MHTPSEYTQTLTQIHNIHSIYNTLGLGNTENVPCDNCNKRQYDYYSDIAVEYLLQKRIWHHPTYAPLVKTKKILPLLFKLSLTLVAFNCNLLLLGWLLSFSLSLTLSVCLSVCLSVSFSRSLDLCLCLSLSHSLCLSLDLYLSLPRPLDLCLSLSHSLWISRSVYVCVCMRVCLSVCLCLSQRVKVFHHPTSHYTVTITYILVKVMLILHVIIMHVMFCVYSFRYIHGK